MIIDAHLHIMEQLVSFNCNGFSRPIGGGCVVYDTGEIARILPVEMGEYSFGYEQALKLMDQHGVDMAVLMQSGGYGIQNSYVMEAAKRYPGRFCPTASFDPYCLKRKEILHNIEEMQFHIFKFELSEVGGYCGYRKKLSVADKEFTEVLEFADAHEMTVAFDVGGRTQASYQIQRFQKAAEQYTHIRFVFCHLLCPDGMDLKSWESDLKKLALPNVWFDFSSLPHFLHEEANYDRSLDVLERAANLLGVRRLIWGSDAPSSLIASDYKALMTYASRSSQWGDDTIALLLGENAKEAYQIKKINRL